MKRFRGGLVFKAHTFVSLNSRLESHKERRNLAEASGSGELPLELSQLGIVIRVENVAE